MGRNAIQDAQKIFTRHVRNRIGNAVAPAMQAMQIATQRAFPEKVGQRMRFNLAMTIKAMRLKRKKLFKPEMHI